MIKSDVQFTHCVTTHHQINERKGNTPSIYSSLSHSKIHKNIFGSFYFSKTKIKSNFGFISKGDGTQTSKQAHDPSDCFEEVNKFGSSVYKYSLLHFNAITRAM